MTASVYGQHKIVFNSPEEIYAFAETHSNVFSNAASQRDLARMRTVSSKLNVVSFKAPVSLNLTNHTRLGVDFLPSEILGGQPGTFTPVTLGQKYVSNIAIEPQLNIINPYTMAQVKVSKTGEQLTAVNQQLARKSLFESISVNYHHIQSSQRQIDITTRLLQNADTLVCISRERQLQGLGRVQDVNTAEASQLAMSDKLHVLKIQLEQYYNQLKVLCDIDLEATVEVPLVPMHAPDLLLSNDNGGGFMRQQAAWQLKYNQAVLRADKRWVLPTLSFFGLFSWRENNNTGFFRNGHWFEDQFVGIKLSAPFLPEPTKMASVRTSRLHVQMARQQLKHAELQDQISDTQLRLDYQKSVDTYRAASRIEGLHRDSYIRNLEIFREGLISTKDMIGSIENWLQSSLNAAGALAAVGYVKSMLLINNTIK